MLKKLLICPYFGDFPPWMGQFIENAKEIKKYGYDILIDTDLQGFKKRVKRVLDIDCPVVWGEPKVWDYRACLGVLYKDEIADYDFYGHCDFDMVFGNLNTFFPDEFYKGLDIHSNHHSYMCGCFSLYRNRAEVREVFKTVPNWKQYLTERQPNGWVEQAFSRGVELSGLNYKYTYEQGDPYQLNPNLELKDGALFQDGIEIPIYHFRISKKWPLTLIK